MSTRGRGAAQHGKATWRPAKNRNFFFAMQRHTRVTAKTQEVKDAMNNDPPYDAFLIHLLVLQLLVTKYGNDPYFTWLLDNTRIHILPSMNPDGFEVSKEGHCESGPGR